MNLINLATDLGLILLLSLIPVAISFFLDYLLGFPAKDPAPNTHAIFFCWTLFLAKRRLKSVRSKNGSNLSLYSELTNGYYEMLNSDNAIVSNNARHQLNVNLITTAREFITWEHATGYCIFCTNVWISGIFSFFIILVTNPALSLIPIYFLPLLIIFFSHLLLRKIN